jgi:hypothetical protein
LVERSFRFGGGDFGFLPCGCGGVLSARRNPRSMRREISASGNWSSPVAIGEHIMTSSPPNPARECIFCLARGMTYEHVWPDWLKRYVPKTIPKHGQFIAEISKDRSTFSSSIKTWAGDPQSRRLPVVCGRCNGGWMKDLQDAAKPILEPILAGKPALITPYQQKLMAAWAAMCVMTGEYYSPEFASIPFSDRDYLRLYREPPKDWRIWIGRYLRGRWAGYWIHHSVPLVEDIPEGGRDAVLPPNTQTTTFIVGQIYIHAFSSALPNITNKWRLDLQGPTILAQLWPIKEGFITWPTNDIRDRDAERIAGHIFWQLDSIARSFGY